MDGNIVRMLITEGGSLLLRLVTSRLPKSQEPTVELESPEEAFQRIYGQTATQAPTAVEELKLKAAQKAMEAVDEELKKEPLKVGPVKRDISTLCITCGKHHITTASAALGEALRFAREQGINSPEVQRRLEVATEECDIAERIDFAPSELERAPAKEKEFLKNFIPKMRSYRHQVDLIRTAEDLEKVAAWGQRLATEYQSKERELRLD